MESIKVIRKYEKEVQNIQEGDQILIPLAEMGEFTATAYKITDRGALFIFDEYVASQPMNNKNTNKGGFEKSDLKKWMDSVLFMAFPDWLRDRITDLSIPTVGEMFGYEDEWDNEHFEPDTDEQLPLMRERENRVAYLKNEWEWGWLRNAMKKEYSSANFAGVSGHGCTSYSGASSSGGVRPAFLLVKEKSGGRVPHNGRVSYKRYYGHGRQDEISKESLMREINEKVNEIDILKQEIERLDKEHQYDEGASEIKALMDSFIRAGFTEGQAFHMVMNMLTTMLGGLR